MDLSWNGVICGRDQLEQSSILKEQDMQTISARNILIHSVVIMILPIQLYMPLRLLQ